MESHAAIDRRKSAEQVRDEHLAVLGPDLGPVYHALQNEVALLFEKWGEYRKLYAKSSERIDLLNETAGYFFRVVQDVLWDDTLLHLARLTDPTQSGRRNKKRLTIGILPALVKDVNVSASREVRTLVNTARKCCEFARDRRNRRLAHCDLALATDSPHAVPLDGASRGQVEQALRALAEVLNHLEGHFFNASVAFEFPLVRNGAEELVSHLAVAVRYKQRQDDGFAQGTLLPEDIEPPPEV